MLLAMKIEETGDAATRESMTDKVGGIDRSQPHLPPAPDGYAGTCLRPRGLCELGGCCDLCIHNPDPKD